MRKELKFKPKQHFASGRVAVCIKCERIGEGSWPSSFLMTHEGFVCGWCAWAHNPEVLAALGPEPPR